MPIQRRQQRELRLVGEFVSEFYPDDRAMFNVRVGAINPRITDQDLTDAETSMLGVHRRRADAVILRSAELVLIEGYILPTLGKVSQVLAYRDLLPNTPELESFASLPITSMIVGPIEDQLLSSIATKQGILTRVYRPPWIEEFINGLVNRKSRMREER